MSTGLFQDEEDGYNLEETKYKIKLDAPESEPALPASDDSGLDSFDDSGDFGDEGGFGGDEGGDDFGGEEKPFDDEPFDADVEADEDEDPEKYIQQLSGKLGTSLRKYNDERGEPDFDLEKYAINSVISASHTSEMEEEDQKDIIRKVKTSGVEDENDDIDKGIEEPEEDGFGDEPTDEPAPEEGGDDFDLGGAEEGLEEDVSNSERQDAEFQNDRLKGQKLLARVNDVLATNPIHVSLHGEDWVIDSAEGIRVPSYNWSDESGPYITLYSSDNISRFIYIDTNNNVKSNWLGNITKEGYSTLVGIMMYIIKNSDNIGAHQQHKMVEAVKEYFIGKVDNNLHESKKSGTFVESDTMKEIIISKLHETIEPAPVKPKVDPAVRPSPKRKKIWETKPVVKPKPKMDIEDEDEMSPQHKEDYDEYLENDADTHYCDICQMYSTVSDDSPYGTCMCS